MLYQRLRDGLRHAEVDDLRDRAVALQGHEDVGRFQIAMNDAFLVGVLNRCTHVERPTLIGRTRIEHLRNSGMVHHRKRLPFGLEPRDHLRRVHARFDYLHRDVPTDGPRLLGEPDFAHASFAKALEKAIRPDRAIACRKCPVGLCLPGVVV